MKLQGAKMSLWQEFALTSTILILIVSIVNLIK